MSVPSLQSIRDIDEIDVAPRHFISNGIREQMNNADFSVATAATLHKTEVVQHRMETPDAICNAKATPARSVVVQIVSVCGLTIRLAFLPRQLAAKFQPRPQSRLQAPQHYQARSMPPQFNHSSTKAVTLTILQTAVPSRTNSRTTTP
jgi:hypothetical protein